MDDAFVLAKNGLSSAQSAPVWRKEGSTYTVKRMDVFNSRGMTAHSIYFTILFQMLPSGVTRLARNPNTEWISPFAVSIKAIWEKRKNATKAMITTTAFNARENCFWFITVLGLMVDINHKVTTFPINCQTILIQKAEYRKKIVTLRSDKRNLLSQNKYETNDSMYCREAKRCS